jgi:hypothetical protein
MVCAVFSSVPRNGRNRTCENGLSMRRTSYGLIALLLLTGGALQAKQPLVVVSIDGLDNRYLAQADSLGLRIPNLRRLVREGQWSAGVIGVVPTITWPSHTSILTGVDPVRHGILSNWRPPGDRFLNYSQIQVPTLIGAARAAGLKTAAVNWPVTVGAPVDWNLPEVFAKRRGGAMDTKSIAAQSIPPGLVESISKDFPSFPQEYMDDRTRTQAVVWILQHGKPDFLLLHLVDLDSEEHDNAPFSTESKAILERTDELLGEILRALPPDGAVAIVSDHGFDRVDKVVNLAKVAPDVVAFGGLAVAPDRRTADRLRELKADPAYGIGREIPLEEYRRFPSSLPANPVAAFESGEGVMFGRGGELFTKPEEIGNHGHWPMRYRSVFVLQGKGIPHETLPEFSIKDIAGRLAGVLGLKF